MNKLKFIIKGGGVITGVLVMAVQIGGCSGKCPCTNKAIHRLNNKHSADKAVAEQQQTNEHTPHLSVTEK